MGAATLDSRCALRCRIADATFSSTFLDDLLHPGRNLGFNPECCAAVPNGLRELRVEIFATGINYGIDPATATADALRKLVALQKVRLLIHFSLLVNDSWSEFLISSGFF